MNDASKSKMHKQATELAEKAAAIRIGLPAGVFGTNSPNKKAAQDLLKSCSELVQTIAKNGSHDEVRAALNTAVQFVDTCYVLGVFSDDELKKYQALTDGIAAELNKE